MENVAGFQNKEIKKLLVNCFQFVLMLRVKQHQNAKLGGKIVILMASNVYKNKNAQIILLRLLVVILVQMVYVFGNKLKIKKQNVEFNNVLMPLILM